MEIYIPILLGLLGLVIGSFLNVCIYRLPRSESLAFPPSRCAKCGHKLKPLDLVPVFSYLFLGSRCRYCGEKISIVYPAVEILNAGLYLAVYFCFGLTWELLVYGSLISLLIVAAFVDFRFQIIPDEIIIIGLILGVVYAATGISGYWLDKIIGAAAGALPLLIIGLCSLFILKKEGMGGGDIKLMAMAGLIIGWRLVITSLLFGVILGALISIALMLLKAKKRGDYLPFGPFLALGIVLSIFFGNDIIHWYISLF